ncbi:MAG TPA: homocysteine S-methyltransferase family protein [Aggregatilineales bacterium]|nr:homocysteine S-methyltransferase family protein [Aggregatilineales bacterium]
MSFENRLAQEKPLLLDGATGTELTRRGVDTGLPLWSAGALESHPEVVRQIHLDYLNAGADIITTNTFRTHARNVRGSARAKQMTLKAVKLAREAVESTGTDALIAGSVAPLEDCYSPHLTPPAGYCQREHMQMIENLAQGGVDFCLIETMNTIHEACAAASAARVMKIPFAVSYILDENQNLLSGEALQDAVNAIIPLEPSAILINCIPTRHISAALVALRGLTDLPLGAYGNMGTPEDVQGWAFEGHIEPDDYCEFAVEWLNIGAKIIGSCCGSSPAHTHSLRTLIDHQFA